MKKRFIRHFLLLISVLLFSCESGPESGPQSDWADITLNAMGSAPIEGTGSVSERVEAIQRAKMDAYMKLQSQIMMLRTESKKPISELAAEDEQISKKISAFIRGAKIVRTENNNNGVEISTELFLGDDFKATLGLIKKKPKPIPNERGSNRMPH